MKICFSYTFSRDQKIKIDIIFLFDYRECIFICETTKVKLAKNIKEWIFK